MCIAVAKPKDLIIDKKILQQCFDTNPDGAGFCVEIDGKLVVNKGYFTFESFYEAFQPYENLKALIHFRIRTHGKVDEENCHPFFITEDIVFVHNGIISDLPICSNKSDTRVFKENYLLPIVNNYGQSALTSPIISKLIEKFIGGSKFVFMAKGQEDFIFYNKSMGNLSKEGIWFSNYSWHIPEYTKPTPLPVRFQHKKQTPKSYQGHPTLTAEKEEVLVLEMGPKAFSFGTTVMVKWPINTVLGTIPKGATGQIEHVYSDRTVDVDFFQEGGVENLYPYALEIIDDLPPEMWENSAFYNERGL